MVERLFLEEWEWWMWGVASLPFIALTIFAAWRLHKMDVSEAKLATELATKLAERQAGDMDMLRRALAEQDERKRAIILGAVVEIEGRGQTLVGGTAHLSRTDEGDDG